MREGHVSLLSSVPNDIPQCRFSRSFGADKWGVVATTVVGAERTWPALRPTAMPDLCLTSLGILAVLSMGGGQDQSVCEKAEEVVCVALAEFCRTSHRPISALWPWKS